MRDWPAGRGRSVLSLAPRICVLTAVLCAFSLALGAPPRAGADSPPYGSVTGATAHLSSLASGATGVTWVVRFRTSGAGALVAGYGTVTLIAPPGTVFPTSGILSEPGSSAGPAPAPAAGRRHRRRGHRNLHRTVEGEQRHRSRAQLERRHEPARVRAAEPRSHDVVRHRPGDRHLRL